jgi:hypothetical protein
MTTGCWQWISTLVVDLFNRVFAAGTAHPTVGAQRSPRPESLERRWRLAVADAPYCAGLNAARNSSLVNTPSWLVSAASKLAATVGCACASALVNFPV